MFCVNAYQFVVCLGAGSFGEVVLARHLDTGKFVAIKCFSKSSLLRQREIRRDGGRTVVITGLDKVQSEMAIMRALQLEGGSEGAPSPNIVCLHSVLAPPGEDELYFVMDHLDAGPVLDAEEDGGEDGAFTRALPLDTVRQITIDLVAALSHCHFRGIAHRDVKPDNVILHSDGRAVLVDFGVAKRFRRRPDGEPVRNWNSSASRLGPLTLASASSAASIASARALEGSDDEGEVERGAGGGEGPDGGGVYPPYSPHLTTGNNSDEGLSGGGQSPFIGGKSVGGVSGGEASRPQSANFAGWDVMGGRTVTPSPPTSNPSPVRPPAYTTETAGAFSFLCPEACAGGGYSAYAADVWALGCTVYAMLFRAVPFGRGTMAEGGPLALMAAVVADELGPLPFERGVDPAALKADPHLASFLALLLSKDPAGRPTITAVGAHPFLSSVKLVNTREEAEAIAAGRTFMAAEAMAATEGEVGAESPHAPPPPRILLRTRFAPMDLTGLLPYHTAEMAVGGWGDGGKGPSSGMELPEVTIGAVDADGAPVVTVRSSSDAFSPPRPASVRSPTDVSMQGWMLKKGRLAKTWHRRYFRLQGRELAYWTGDPVPPSMPPQAAPPSRGARLTAMLAGVAAATPSPNGARPGAVSEWAGPGSTANSPARPKLKGSMRLAGKVTVTRKPKDGKPLRFELTADGRTITLQAESEEGVVAWLAALNSLPRS